MSAIFLGSQTIDAAVELYGRLTGPLPGVFLDHLGRDFWTLNVAALGTLYDTDDDELLRPIAEYTFREKSAFSVPVLLKSLDCLIYQCTEGTIPATSKTYAQLTELAEFYAQDGVRLSSEYADAPWGLCDDLADNQAGVK